MGAANLSVGGLAVALILLGVLLRLIYQLLSAPLRSFPGPWLWKLSAIPYYLSTVRGTSHSDLLRLHRKYGNVVQIAPQQLSYANEVAWKDVWGHRQGHAEFTKATVAAPVNGVQGILGADREAHSRFRRAFAHAFSAQGLREQEQRVNYYVTLLLDGLASDGTKKAVDVVQWFNWMTIDLIGDLAFGESFGCLEHARTHPWIADIFGNIAGIVWLTAARGLGLSLLLPLMMPRSLVQARLENYRFTADKMKTRAQLGSERGDFFDKILAKDVNDGGMTTKEMESNASNLVLAGSETTATQLSGTVALLLQHPSVLAKLTDNIRNTFGSEEEITIESCSKDRYLLAVLDEAMRLYPPVPSFASRRVPSPGDSVGGRFIPGGTIIHFSHVAAYRLQSNFAYPDEFAPERWMGDPRFAQDNRSTFNPFSAGPRNCIGKNLAYAEMRLVVAKLLWRFDLSVPSHVHDLDQWIERQKTYVLWEKLPLLVEMNMRKSA